MALFPTVILSFSNGDGGLEKNGLQDSKFLKILQVPQSLI